MAQLAALLQAAAAEYGRPEPPAAPPAEPAAPRWQTCFELLAEHLQTGAELPPDGAEVQGVRLGCWCAEQQRAFAAGRLPLAQIRALSNLPGWFWGARRTDWRQRFRLLQRFTEEHGRVPCAREEYQGQALGVWCSAQRRAHRKGLLPLAQAVQLQTLPVWSWGMPHRITAKKRGPRAGLPA